MDLTGPDFSKARYWTELDERGERLVMPIRLSWKTVGAAVLSFGFALTKFHTLFEPQPGWFDYAVFFGIALGALHLTLNILTSLLAREVLYFEAGHLVHGWRLLGMRREKRYPVNEIFGLSTAPEATEEGKPALLSPLKDFGKRGALNFEFRGKTVGLGAVLDAAHGQQVVIWLARRLPRTALQP